MGPRTRARAREQRLDGPGRIADIIRLFDPSENLALGNAPAVEPLTVLRNRIHSELLNTARDSTTDEDTLYDNLADRATEGIQSIETCRRNILKDLRNNDVDPSGRQPDSLEDEACARSLQSAARRIHNLPRHSSEEQDQFACGVLLMLLELVVRRSTADAPRQRLYERLISHPPTSSDRLCVVQCLSRFTEDVFRPFSDQIQRILSTFQTLPARLQPPSDMVEQLQTRLPSPRSLETTAMNLGRGEDDEDDDEDDDMEDDNDDD